MIKVDNGNTPGTDGVPPAPQEHILKLDKRKDRCLQAVRELTQASARPCPQEEYARIRDDVGFLRAPRAALELASRLIVSRAVVSDGIIDTFAAAGLDKPDISVLSDWPRCGGCPT